MDAAHLVNVAALFQCAKIEEETETLTTPLVFSKNMKGGVPLAREKRPSLTLSLASANIFLCFLMFADWACLKSVPLFFGIVESPFCTEVVVSFLDVRFLSFNLNFAFLVFGFFFICVCFRFVFECFIFSRSVKFVFFLLNQTTRCRQRGVGDVKSGMLASRLYHFPSDCTNDDVIGHSRRDCDSRRHGQHAHETHQRAPQRTACEP